MQDEELLTVGELVAIFKVHPRTVARWADEGKIDAIRTPGGQRRFRRSEVAAFLNNRKG
jgi:excisionase family DNA binding protein